VDPIKTLTKGFNRARTRGAGHLLASMGFSQGVLLLLGIFLARILGPGDFGHIRVIGAVLKLAAIPAALGLPAAVSKYAAEAGGGARGREIFSQGASFSLLVSFAVAAGLVAVLSAFDPLGDDVARRYLLVLVWTVPPAVFTAGAAAFLQGMKQIRLMAGCQALLAGGRVLLVGALTLGFLLPGYAAGLGAAEWAGAVFMLVLTRPSIRFRWDRALLARMVRLGAFASLGLSFATLTLTMDTLCLSAILGDPVLVGRYGAASTVALGLMLVPEGISQTFFPYLSEACRNRRLLRTYFSHLSELVGLAMLAVCGGVFLFAGPLIGLIFGPEYGQSAAVLRALLPGIFFYALQKISGTVLFARGRTDLNCYVTLAGGIVNVLMNIAFIKRFGLIGAAYATSLTFALRAAVSFLLFFRELRDTGAEGPRP